MEPSCAPLAGHSRNVSLSSNGCPTQFGGHLPVRPGAFRRSTSPAERFSLASPASMASPHDSTFLEPSSSQRPSLAHARSSSATTIPTHSRNVSSSSIDASILSRFGFPTYRHTPASQSMPGSAPMSRTPSAMSHLAPIAMPAAQMQSYPARRRTASPPATTSRISVELDYDPTLDMTTSTMLDYLTAPNPAPYVVQRTVESGRGQNPHFWFDVRNLRSWSDFTVDTITSIPGLMALLQVPVPARQLPTPGKVNLNPETPQQLTDLCATHYGVKINAVLKHTQGDKHISMRTLSRSSGPRQSPEFISNYQSDVEKTVYGDGGGRVVGITKCYDQWNSGMRHDSPGQKVKYLQGLAHLHRYMREHSCRYGFIMTEIELVCVRAGGPPSEKSQVPLFGYVEVATAVQMATHGTDDGANGVQMTAGLALWYLHMLAKEHPFPGQYGWKMDVGGPAALTRKHHLARDEWMPRPNQSEKREAKRVRGWMWPDEALSKRECGKGRRTKV